MWGGGCVAAPIVWLSVRLCFLTRACCNPEHRVDQEIGGKVSESSFALAMALARGTISVVDEGGITFSRIWCGN